MPPRVLDQLLKVRSRLTVKIWVLKVSLGARATGSVVEIDVHDSVRIGRRVRVQFDRNTRNRLVVGPHAILRDDVLLQLRGGSIQIGPGCDLRESCRLNVAGNLVLEGQNVFGWACTIHCKESVLIREMCSCSEYVTIVDSRHFHTADGRWFYENSESSPVVVGRNVWLASKSTVMMGAHLGDDCLVGANSVVGGVVESGTVVAGVPARPIRSSKREE